MHRLHPYPDVQVMFRRLLIATLIGLLAALAVALFRHAMVVLETLLLSNDSGSLVNAAQSLPAWRRLVTPALGGLTAEPYSGSGNDAASRVHMPPPIIWKPWRPATAVSIRRQAW